MEKLDVKVVSDFKGTINGIEVRDESVFWTSQYFLEVLQNDYDFTITNELVLTMVRDIGVVVYKYDELNMGEFESEVVSNFENGNFELTIYGDDYRFIETNELLQKGK